MKILVLSCSTGGGHNACGHYITQEFNDNGITCDFVDYFSILGPKMSKQAEMIYLGTTRGNGTIFKEVYKLGETYSKTGIPSPVYGLNKLARKKLYNFIAENNYDLIIATHLFPAMAVTALKKENKDIKLVNIATDYTVIPFWEETNPDYFVIPHETLKDEFINKGFKEEILLPFGISVSSSFCKTKNNLDLPKDKEIVLITSGSMGFGKIKDIVKTMLKKVPNTYFIVACGNNKALYSELNNWQNHNLLVKGYIENMNEYISASTIVLTKPGGLTSTEVGVLHKPIVHIMPIPGVENYNAEFFAKNGLSLISNTIEEIVENTNKLLTNKELQEDIIERQKQILNEHSAQDLVNFVTNKWM